MPLNADKAVLLDTICGRLGGNRQRNTMEDMLQRGIARYYEANATMQERLMRAMQHSFLEYEKSRLNDDTLVFTDVQTRFRRWWIRSMKKGDYDTHRTTVPKPIVEVP